MSKSLFAWAQILLGLYFGLEMTIVLIQNPSGASVSWIMCSWIFILVNATLALSSYRVFPSTDGKNTIWIYSSGVLVYSILLLVSLPTGGWDANDTMTLQYVLFGVLTVIIIKESRQFLWVDPVVRAMFAVVAKVVPQLLLAEKIFLTSSLGISWKAIIVFHILTCLRIMQIVVQGKMWDRSRKSLLFAELTNEASWMVVTCVAILIGKPPRWRFF